MYLHCRVDNEAEVSKVLAGYWTCSIRQGIQAHLHYHFYRVIQVANHIIYTILTGQVIILMQIVYLHINNNLIFLSPTR